MCSTETCCVGENQCGLHRFPLDGGILSVCITAEQLRGKANRTGGAPTIYFQENAKRAASLKYAGKMKANMRCIQLGWQQPLECLSGQLTADQRQDHAEQLVWTAHPCPVLQHTAKVSRQHKQAGRRRQLQTQAPEAHL